MPRLSRGSLAVRADLRRSPGLPEDIVQRNRPLALALLGLVVAAAAAAVLLTLWRRPVVRWQAVLDAAARKRTVHGKGRVYVRDGPEWEYALWGTIGPDGRCASKGMLRQVGLSPKGEAAAPQPEVLMLCQAMDYCGEGGIVVRLASDAADGVRARRERWGGREVLAVDVESPEGPGAEEAGGPDGWRLFLDPETMLLLVMDLYVVEEGRRTVTGMCEYEYDVPLPPGFDEAPTRAAQ